MTDFEALTFLGVMALGTIELVLWTMLAFIMGVFVLSYSAKMVLRKDEGFFTAGIVLILAGVVGILLGWLLGPLGIPYLGSIISFIVTLVIIQYMYKASLMEALGISVLFIVLMVVIAWALGLLFGLGAALIAASDATMATVWWIVLIAVTAAAVLWGANKIFKMCTGACRTRPIARLTGR